MLHETGRTLTILVVEDDEPVAELVRTVLNDVPGWGATVVHDGAAAREVFRHVQIEILLVDVNLPGLSGLELLTLLRADPHWQEPPVILVSANPDQPGLQEAVNQGQAVRFIAKPFEVEQIVEAVHQAAAEFLASR
jgi:CheY-like chemotaxis protein